jgi:hypothetical protein
MIFRTSVRVIFFCFICCNNLSAQVYPLPHDLKNFLQTSLDLTSRQISDVQRGEVVTGQIDTEVGYEIATFGITLVNLPPQAFLDYMTVHDLTIEHLQSLERGLFNDPPQHDDLDSLTLDSDDLETLRKARIGNSPIKLSEEAITLFRQESLWTPSDAKQTVEPAFRSMLIDNVNKYRMGGNNAMVVYHDKEDPLHLGQESQHLIRELSFLKAYHPDIHANLALGQRDSLLQTRNVILWTKDDFGASRKVISMDHVVVFRPTVPQIADVLIIAKRLYASHYNEASLGITVLAYHTEGNPKYFYLIYMNWARIDGLRNRLVRYLAKGRVKNGMVKRLEDNLQYIKTQGETLYQAELTSP